jgi:hypothetical protein
MAQRNVLDILDLRARIAQLVEQLTLNPTVHASEAAVASPP